MPIVNPGTFHPGQYNGTGSLTAAHIEEITGEVANTIQRLSVFAPRVPMRPLRGTSILSTHAIGKTSLQAQGPGQAGNSIPATNTNKLGRVAVSVDTLLIARDSQAILEELQAFYDVRIELGQEQGTAHAHAFDETVGIMATKAALMTSNTYGIAAGNGHDGGTQVTFGAAADANDPALIYDRIVKLITAMRKKDVDPIMEGSVLVTDHDTLALLSMNELLINTEYKTSDSTSIQQLVLKAHGLPVVASNAFCGGKNITSHLLSNATNGNAYNGDFTKVKATLFTPKALLAAETMALQSDVFFDKVDKLWYVDSWRAYGIGPRSAHHAGAILLP